MAESKPLPEWLTWYEQAAEFVRVSATKGTVVERIEDPAGRSISFGRSTAPAPQGQRK